MAIQILSQNYLKLKILDFFSDYNYVLLLNVCIKRELLAILTFSAHLVANVKN